FVRMVHQRNVVAIHEHRSLGVLALAQSAEEVEITGVVGAADHVEDAVAVEVHQLGTGGDASVDGRLRLFTAGAQLALRRENRACIRTPVREEPEETWKVADEQVAHTVAIDVFEPGTGVRGLRKAPDADRLARGP